MRFQREGAEACGNVKFQESVRVLIDDLWEASEALDEEKWDEDEDEA